MGCDIHGWIEVKNDGKWIAVMKLKDDNRNYDRFCKLAEVRCHGSMMNVMTGGHITDSCDAKAHGIPDDISETAGYDIKVWGVDGHSHSYLPIKEAAQIFLDTVYGDISEFDTKYPYYTFFDIEIDKTEGPGVENYRLVFWFDN